MEGLESKVQQFGNNIAYPGLGPGGHCIPEDIHYLIQTSKNNINLDMKILKDAVEINENMPMYIYKKLNEQLKRNNDKIENMNILMLGISYKPNSDDTRCSPAIRLYNIIKERNPNCYIFDSIAKPETKYEHFENELEIALDKANIVFLSCPHDIFLDIDYSKYSNIKYIADCWNKLNKNRIESSGINYIGVGI